MLDWADLFFSSTRVRAVSSRRPPRALQVSETLRDCLESSPTLQDSPKLSEILRDSPGIRVGRALSNQVLMCVIDHQIFSTGFFFCIELKLFSHYFISSYDIPVMAAVVVMKKVLSIGRFSPSVYLQSLHFFFVWSNQQQLYVSIALKICEKYDWAKWARWAKILTTT